MHRYTRKDKRFYNSKATKPWKKLQQLEDIEQELGIDLVTLFKALDIKFASLYKNQDGKYVVKPFMYDYTLTPKEFVNMALTKEELE